MATRTIGSGGDHADIDAWNAYLQTIDPFSAIQEGLIVAAGISVTTQQDLTGFDQNGFGWVLRANTSASFREHASASSNPLIYDSTKGAFVDLTATSDQTIVVSVTNGTIKDLQIRKSFNYGSVIDTTDSANTLDIDSCILEHTVSNADRIVRLRKGTCKRSLIVSNGSNGIAISSGDGTLDGNTLINKGAAGSTNGIIRDYGTWGLSNNACAGFNTDVSGTIASGSHNATDSAAGGFPATNRQNSLVLATEFESATVDFRLKSTSAKCKDLGTGSLADIIGQAASGTKDIGAWELQAAGATAKPKHLLLMGVGGG